MEKQEIKPAGKKHNKVLIGITAGLIIMLVCCCISSVILGITFHRTINERQRLDSLLDMICKNPSNPELKDIYDHFTTGKFKDKYTLKDFRELYVDYPEIMQNCKESINSLTIPEVLSGKGLVTYLKTADNEFLNIEFKKDGVYFKSTYQNLNGIWKIEDLTIK